MNVEALAKLYIHLFESNLELDEGTIDSDKLYFHGSENGNIKRLYAPTPEKPLFVTADIDYANEYLQAAHPNGHAKFDEDESPGKVYIIDLDFDDIKLFDARIKDDKDSLEHHWPPYILDQLAEKDYSIWSVFRYLIPTLKKFYIDFNRDFVKFSKYIQTDKNFEDEMGKESLLDGIQIIDEKYGDKILSLFSENNPDEDPDFDNVLFGIITMFNNTLVEEGFNAFRNTETLRAGKLRQAEIKTTTAIGIMDKECIKDFCPKPLDTEMVKQAIEDLKSDGGSRNYTKSNQSLIDKVVDKVEGND